MNFTLQELTERLGSWVAEHPAPDGSLKLALHEGGIIRVEGRQVSNEDEPADCTLIMRKADLDEYIDGQIDAQTALMQGKLDLLGDIGVASAMEGTLLAAWRPS